MTTVLNVLLILLFVAVLAVILAPVIAGIRWVGRRVESRVDLRDQMRPAVRAWLVALPFAAVIAVLIISAWPRVPHDRFDTRRSCRVVRPPLRRRPRVDRHCRGCC